MATDAGDVMDGLEEGNESVDCREAVHRLYHFLDGELTEERREAIAEHLHFCGPCVDAYGFEGELRKLIADRCRDHVPEQLKERVAAAIDHERRQAKGAAGD